MFFVYILESVKTKTYYVGCTNNLERRLKEHNFGLSRYTKMKAPWIIIYREAYQTLVEARHRERQIKSWKKRRAIEKLISAAIV